MHAIVLIALIPSSLVLMIRFFSAQNNLNRLFVAADAAVVAAIVWLLWTPRSWRPTIYGLLGDAALLAALLFFLIVRWLPAARAAHSDRAKGP